MPAWWALGLTDYSTGAVRNTAARLASPNFKPQKASPAAAASPACSNQNRVGGIVSKRLLIHPVSAVPTKNANE